MPRAPKAREEPVVSSKQQIKNAAEADALIRGVKIEGFQPECTQTDPEVFFPMDEDARGRANAKLICARCEIREACLEAALVLEAGRVASGRFGIWGGLTEGERERVSRQRRRARRAEG